MADIGLTELVDCGLASLVSRSGTAPAADALWAVAPGQWLAFAPGAAPGWADRLGEQLAGQADVVDQSSAYVVWHLTGADAQRLLQKGLPVDLAGLAPGATVVSAIAHIGVIVHCPAPGTFYLAVFRSFAPSFRDWLDATIAALPFDTGSFA